MSENPGPTLIRALKLPLRDVHDLCATGDIDYLLEFAHDEEHRLQKGLGRAFSKSRKATSPVRRAEHLQASKIAEKKREIEEKKELLRRQKKKEENRRRRKAEAEAEAREEAAEYGSGGEEGSGAGEESAGDEDPYSATAAASGGEGGFDEENDEEEQENSEARRIEFAEQELKQNSLLMSTGAGSTQQDLPPIDEVFPRPHLGKVSQSATEDAFFNTVGLSTVSVADLINIRDEHNLLPIHTACVFGQGEIVDFLMKHGADIESVVPETLYRPLHFAVMNGHDKLAKRLVETYAAKPGALTAKFELPITLCKNRHNAHMQIYFKNKCRDQIKKNSTTNALDAANDGDLLFFAYHYECDEDNGKYLFCEEFIKHRPKPLSAAEAQQQIHSASISIDQVMRDPVTTPLDVAVTAFAANPNSTEHKRIIEFLLAKNFYELNEPRDSHNNAVTTLQLAVTIPCREAVLLLLKYDADPRVGGVYNSAPTQILKLILAEAEAKIMFEEVYKTRDNVSFEERSEFISSVSELRFKWKKAKHQLERALNQEEISLAAQAAQEEQERRARQQQEEAASN